MTSLSVQVSVERIPEVLADMRAEFARIVRRAAASETDKRVAKRLLEIAAQFEAGAS